MTPKTLIALLSTAALVAPAAIARPQVQGKHPVQEPHALAPQIKAVTLTFDNGADGKDFDTKLHVFMYPAGFKVGSDERQGALLGYMQPNANTPYAANSTTSVDLADYTSGSPKILPTTLNRNTFVGTHGGRLYLNFFRNGHDTWVVKAMTLSIRYVAAKPRVVTFPGFTTKEGGPAIVFDFDENFNPVKR